MVDTVLGRLRVQLRGSGEAIMFWPSLLMTGDMWAAQADHFGDRCRVIWSTRRVTAEARS
jgi:3-oxoadipate enol-lactonase